MSNQVNTASHPKAKNPFVEALHNLKKNKMACVGGVIFTASIFVFINLLVDILYAYVDPRVKAQYKS